ncbi:MAG TPA: proline dehydrogenase family protein, partial [Capillimicrobium sp.]
MTDPTLEEEIRRVGTELAAAFPSAARHPLKAIDAKAMDLASQDEELRAALFRFVDVVPACRSLDDLAAHLTGFLDEVGDAPPPLARAVALADRSAAGRKALGAAAAAGVRHMAHRFIVAETPHAAGQLVRRLWHRGVATSVDLLGEATVTTDEADRYAQRCHEALDRLAAVHEDLPHRLHLERDGHGPLPRPNLSVKVSALTPLLRAEAPERGMRDAGARLAELLRHAHEVGAHLHIDMESLDSREAIVDLVLALLAEERFADGPSAGMVLQAYLRDSDELLERLLAWAAATPRRQPLV